MLWSALTISLPHRGLTSWPRNNLGEVSWIWAEGTISAGYPTGWSSGLPSILETLPGCLTLISHCFNELLRL